MKCYQIWSRGCVEMAADERMDLKDRQMDRQKKPQLYAHPTGSIKITKDSNPNNEAGTLEFLASAIKKSNKGQQTMIYPLLEICNF